MDKAIDRVEHAVSISAKGHGNFSCWTGPTGAGTVRIAIPDLQALCTGYRRMVQHLKPLAEDLESPAHLLLKELGEI